MDPDMGITYIYIYIYMWIVLFELNMNQNVWKNQPGEDCLYRAASKCPLKAIWMGGRLEKIE